ncbi:MAG: dTDP-4-dehydrorhamnose reductase [Chlamydiota bacterium]|jgi:dTDP-4-dehydrorhamnose reductase
MKLWIPGKQGLLGSTLTALAPCPVIGTARQEVDISQLDQVRAFVTKHPDITHIVNCAAMSMVDDAEQHPSAAWRANVTGPENLAHIALEKGIKLIHISTDYVFSGTTREPLKETDPTVPCNIYGQSKLEGERRVLNSLPSSLVLRVSWLFGDGGKNLVAKLWNLFATEEEVRLINDQYGRPTYCPDLCQAIFQMLGHEGICHFANQGVATKYQFGTLFLEEAKRQGFPLRTMRIRAARSTDFPMRCERPVYTAFDTHKIESALSIQIRPWQEALREYVREKRQ